jgi:tRNA pseudouridine55 synthase
MTTHGVLLLDKPLGMSSNSAVQRVRRLFGRTKAGHTGTLDPLATGLLPICMGEATKFAHGLLDADKAYEAVIRLGFVSSTGDAEGRIEPFRPALLSVSRLEEVLRDFTGPLSQMPPMHSALKKDGRPLYEYARAGEEVAREPRNIVIKDLELIDFTKDCVAVKVLCSKGTYIRVLAQDIGQALGCGGYLLGLRRTRVGDLDLGGAIDLERLEALDPVGRPAHVLAADRLLAALPAVRLEPEAAQRVRNGLEVAADADPHSGSVRLYCTNGGFLGVGERSADGRIVPRRMVSTGVEL